MKFTDDDLKRLKERNIGANSGKPYAQVIMSREEFEALLARLEAAESLLDLWMKCDDDCEIDGNVFDAAMKKWKKAAGK